MITTKEVKIKRCDKLTSEYVETQLKNMGFDVLRWAITAYDDEFYILNLAVVED